MTWLRDNNTHVNKPEPVCGEEESCGECNECSRWCDVCGIWYCEDEPCEFH